MVRSGLLLATTSLVALVVTGCSSSGTGSSDPTTGPKTPTSLAQAVEIENPKNLKAVDDTCSLMTSAQLAKFGLQDVQPQKSKSNFGTQRCEWNGEDLSFTITPDMMSGGISALYQQPNVQKTTVSDYPAALLNRANILCRVEVGVAKNAKFAISYTALVGSEKAASGTVKPCKQGEKIASMVLKNIPDA